MYLLMDSYTAKFHKECHMHYCIARSNIAIIVTLDMDHYSFNVSYMYKHTFMHAWLLHNTCMGGTNNGDLKHIYFGVMHYL